MNTHIVKHKMDAYNEYTCMCTRAHTHVPINSREDRDEDVNNWIPYQWFCLML